MERFPLTVTFSTYKVPFDQLGEFLEMMAEIYPDKEEREKIQTKFLKMWKGHTDAITVEVPGIRK